VGYDKSEAGRGNFDMWAVKLNANGGKVWDKRFGGTGQDVCRSVIATSDGGYLLAGYSSSGAGGDKSQGKRSYQDYWAVKIDDIGNKIWDKRFGVNRSNAMGDCHSVVAIAGGGFVLAGESTSEVGGDKSESGRGSFDYWAVKIDANGNK